MDYRVEELAAASGIRVDTIRFYQRRGLIEPPERRGRAAFYGERHRARLRRIRELLDEGFSLAQIARLGSDETPAPTAGQHQGLLAALLAEREGERSYSRPELATEAGVPEALITAAETAGLITPIDMAGEARYAQADVEMGKAALALLGAGLPIDELMSVAVEHAQNVERLADAGIELFDQHIRQSGDTGHDREAVVAGAFRDLLPEVTRLVALHFQRTLLSRAFERMNAKGDRTALEAAVAATANAKLEVQWR